MIAGIGVLIVLGFLLQSASAYNTVVVAASGGIYVEAIVGGPRYINPVLSHFNEADASIASLVFSGLTRLDECGNILPDLATSWEITADGKQYTFHLREDAYWHDGVPVVAEDVAFTISVVQSPDYAGSPAIARLWRDVRVTVVDEHQVRFELPEPYAPFLTYTNLGILPAHVLQGMPVADLAKAEFNRLPIGSGPFMVSESDADHVLLSPSSSYYGEPPYLAGIEFRFFRDLGEALRAHERGEVLGIAGITSEYLPAVAANTRLNVYSVPMAREAMLLLNLKGANATFLEDKLVRQALMYGLDRGGLISRVLEGRALLAHAPFSICSWALDANGPTYEYDPPRARDILDTQGWSDHDGDGIRDKDGKSLRLTLLVPDERGSKAVGQEIARQWQSLGVQVEVEALSFPDMVEKRLQPREFDAALVELSLEGDPDPYPLWHSSQAQAGGQNYSSFVNREADGLLESARREWDQEKRQQMYWRFQQILMEELPALPLYYPIYTYAVDQSVHGVQLGPLTRSGDRFRTLPQWYINFKRLRLRRVSSEEQQ